MTALLGVDDHREPPDCPFTWGDGYVPCTYHDLPVHRCLIQGGHDGSCLCMCLDEPSPVLPRPQRFNWTGYLDECCAFRPTATGQPCVAWNPVSAHMCVDGDDSVKLGHEPHHPFAHTCRCGKRFASHSGRRLIRDMHHVVDEEVGL